MARSARIRISSSTSVLINPGSTKYVSTKKNPEVKYTRMTYGRSGISRSRMVRRGPRPSLRTRRVGYPTGKAYLRRRQGVKRSMPVLLSPRPIKRRKVIQTRSTLPPRTKSKFKTQREIIATKFLTNGTGTTSSTNSPDSTRQLFSLFLSPKCDGDAYRKMEDSKGRYVGCNITGAINFDHTFLGAKDAKFVIRVVQCNVTDTFGGSNINFGNDAIYMSQFWKDQDFSNPEYTYKSYENPSFQTRSFLAMNMAKFKVLKTKYIHVNDLTPEHKTKGFHFYIPMRAQLERDRHMSAIQWNDNRTTNATTSVIRYAYYKPIVLLIEPVLKQTDTFPGNNFSFAGLDVCVKHTFKDGV